MQEMANHIASWLNPKDIVFLQGPLGVGKTALARAILRDLSDNEDLDVPSPTFSLAQYYDTRKGAVTHFDLYRLEEPEEVLNIGWEDAIADGIALVEWPERLGYLMPARYLDIHLAMVDQKPEQRIMTYEWMDGA